MHYDASLRVRDLTQNIYDIGDEIAEHIEHIAQAIADWDGELVEDCLLEFTSVVRQGRKEVRPGLAELNGLRQAFVSGVRSGEMSNTFHHPGRTLSFLRKGAPTPPPESNQAATGVTSSSQGADDGARPQMATTAGWRLWLRERNEDIIGELAELSEWVVQQTDLAINAQAVLLPQVFNEAEKRTREIVAHWQEGVAKQPAVAQAMRGEAPPQFLSERARIEQLIAKLTKRRGRVV